MVPPLLEIVPVRSGVWIFFDTSGIAESALITADVAGAGAMVVAEGVAAVFVESVTAVAGFAAGLGGVGAG